MKSGYVLRRRAEREQRHRCRLPGAIGRRWHRLRDGALWRCAFCDQVWELRWVTAAGVPEGVWDWEPR